MGREIVGFSAEVPVDSEPQSRGRTRQTLKAIGWGLFWVVLSLGAVLFGVSQWIKTTFGAVTIDQLLLHLPGAGGAEATAVEQGYAQSFFVRAIGVPLAAIGVLAGLWLVARGMRMLRNRQTSQTTTRRRARMVLATVGAVGVAGLGASSLVNTVNLADYVQSITTHATMSSFYSPPQIDEHNAVTVGAAGSQSELQTATPKNLITIYLESVDNEFSNADLFGANLLQPLEDATAEWARFDALRTYVGGGWTMAGLVGTQCGVPLRGPGTGENDINSNNIGADFSDYLPGAVCLGDVLSAAGYTNVYLGGANKEFASKDRFLMSHGFDVVKGVQDWEAEGVAVDGERGLWGISDRTLLEEAKLEVTRLYEAGQPFYLSTLTLDFHAPAFLPDHCTADLDEPLSSVLLCSMSEVAEFIEFLEASGYLESTVVVVMADHPLMIPSGGTYYDELGGFGLQERVLFNRIWSPDGVELLRRDVDQLSMFATMLELLDFELEDGVAGVGVSAVSAQAQNAPILNLSEGEYRELLNSRSADLYARLWGQTEVLVAIGAED